MVLWQTAAVDQTCMYVLKVFKLRLAEWDMILLLLYLSVLCIFPISDAMFHIFSHEVGIGIYFKA